MTPLWRRVALLPLVLLLAACPSAPEVADVSGGADQSSGASQGEVEPYVVKGHVTDAHGSPMVGVQVGADNTLLYDSNAIVVTDAAGAYRIDLSSMETTWRLWGRHNVAFDGQQFRFDLAVDESPFASSEGAIRDLTWRLSGPYAKDADLSYGGTGWVYEDLDSYALDDMSLVTLSMVPAGSLVDGSPGVPLTFRLEPSGAFQDVPIGRYVITATYDGQKLLVRPRNDGEYAESAEVGFTAGVLAGDMQLEVLPLSPSGG